MKEFKFIRGKYTSESIFDSEITDNALFAFDSESEKVNLASTNNEAFQEYFAKKYSDRVGDIFTFLPSQFKFEGELVRPASGDPYFHFTATANEHPSQDANVDIPSKVLTAAKSELEAKLTTDANPKEVPLYIDENDKLNSFKKVTFTYNNKKTFERNCHFQLQGKVQERSYGEANGQPTEVYKLVDGLIDSENPITGATFHNGKLQKEVASVVKTIISNTQSLGEGSTIGLAQKYIAADGHSFIPDDGSVTTLKSYAPGDEIKLYENVYSGLRSSTIKAALGSTLSRLLRNDNYSGTLYSLKDGVFSAVSDFAVGTYYKEDTSGTLLAYNNNGVLTEIANSNIYTLGSITEKFSSVSDEITLETSGDALYTYNDAAVNSISIAIVPHISNISSNGSSSVETYDVTVTINNGTPSTEYQKVAAAAAVNKANSIFDDIVKKYTKVTEVTAISSDTTYYFYGGNASALVSSVVEKLSQVDVYAEYYRNVKDGYVVYKSKLASYEKTAGDDVYIAPTNASGVSEVLCSSDGTPKETHYYFQSVTSSTPIAFVHKADFTIPDYEDNIIYDYNPSYTGLFVLVSDNSKPEESNLRPLGKTDIESKEFIDVYTDGGLYCFGNKCYANDSESESEDYVAYNDDWTATNFTKDNVSIGANNIIRPVITSDVDRRIYGEYSVTVIVD